VSSIIWAASHSTLIVRSINVARIRWQARTEECGKNRGALDNLVTPLVPIRGAAQGAAFDVVTIVTLTYLIILICIHEIWAILYNIPSLPGF
jgi:hypothetical protein